MAILAPIEPASEPHPLVACSRALDATWTAVDRGDGEAARASLDVAEAIEDCRRLDTTAGRAYLEARTALLEGRPESALRALQRAVSAPTVRVGDRPQPAELLYYLALTEEVLGQQDAAIQHYTTLAREHPADAHVAACLPLLGAAVATSSEERLAAALRAVETHNYSAAERLLTQVITDLIGQPFDPTAPDVGALLRDHLADGGELLGEAVYQLGYLWYYWIRVRSPQSIPLLAAVAEAAHDRRADATYYLARAYMRSEDYDAARRLWSRFADQFPGDDRAHEATYYRGWLYLDREAFAESIPGFEDYLDHFGRASRRERARWYLGWAHFRLGQFAEARRQFASMAEDAGYLYGAKGRYWEGRCWREEGREEEARAAFSDVAARYTFTYYGLLARQRLDQPLVPPRAHTPPPDVARRLSELAESHPSIAVLEQLIEVGSPFHVARYYEWTEPDRLGDPLDRLMVRQAAGDAYDDFREARGRNNSALRRPPDADSLLHWVRRYPRPYSRWVEREAGAVHVDPLLIWSHMQIESHYNGTFVSYADAQGLLQLIPRTGQRVAAALGDSYSEGILMNPAVNIRYGTWYLSALIDDFGGQLPLAITGYNAGGGSVQRWVTENHELPFDAFVEEIPYDQSREYVKKVIGMYVHYLVLYADDSTLEATLPRLLPERIDPTLVRGEIDW